MSAWGDDYLGERNKKSLLRSVPLVSPSTRRRPRRRSMSVLARTGDGIRGISVERFAA